MYGASADPDLQAAGECHDMSGAATPSWQAESGGAGGVADELVGAAAGRHRPPLRDVDAARAQFGVVAQLPIVAAAAQLRPRDRDWSVRCRQQQQRQQQRPW